MAFGGQRALCAALVGFPANASAKMAISSHWTSSLSCQRRIIRSIQNGFSSGKKSRGKKPVRSKERRNFFRLFVLPQKWPGTKKRGVGGNSRKPGQEHLGGQGGVGGQPVTVARRLSLERRRVCDPGLLNNL